MNENLEQPIKEDLGSNSYGKFKDAESLLKAYNSLEAEFTKKSQKLSLLESENVKTQNEITKKAENDKRVDEFVNKFDIAKPFSSALKESLHNNNEVDLKEEVLRLVSKTYKSAEAFSKDDEFLNNYIFSNESIKNKIVKDYLSKITQSSPIKVENGGASISLCPPNIPKTIKEAGTLAKSIIKHK
ncbi:MAG: hypothetical protein IKY10_00935 [Clostridia bacterium]|nr:hypothetical protein [Clostridia bacterium]